MPPKSRNHRFIIMYRDQEHTISELAKQMNVSHSTIRNWMDDKLITFREVTILEYNKFVKERYGDRALNRRRGRIHDLLDKISESD